MPDVSCDIGDLECHQCRQIITYLVMEKSFPDTNLADTRPFILYLSLIHI